jgi:DnaJ-class molecular chaperone
MAKCKRCKGKGWISNSDKFLSDCFGDAEDCPACKGTGYIFTKPTPAQCRKVAERLKPTESKIPINDISEAI